MSALRGPFSLPRRFCGIADNAVGDYVKNSKTGKFEFNYENVHRAKLRIDERHWQMVRLDPRLWSDRSLHQHDVNYLSMSKEELMETARELLGLAPLPRHR